MEYDHKKEDNHSFTNHVWALRAKKNKKSTKFGHGCLQRKKLGRTPPEIKDTPILPSQEGSGQTRMGLTCKRGP